MTAVLLAKVRNAYNKKAKNKLEDKFNVVTFNHVRRLLLCCIVKTQIMNNKKMDGFKITCLILSSRS